MLPTSLWNRVHKAAKDGLQAYNELCLARAVTGNCMVYLVICPCYTKLLTSVTKTILQLQAEMQNA